MRLPFEAQGCECVFSSEYNKFSKKTYIENFGNNHLFVDDIVPFPPENVPDHDILLAGFPCQPFSIAGVSKKNSLGREHGFKCENQGNLFFNITNILEAKRPKAFLLENVKNLLSHDKGNTFKVILDTLMNELNYNVHYKVIDGKYFTPQHRERIFIVGFRDKTDFSWNDLILPTEPQRIGSILHKTDGNEPLLLWDRGRYFGWIDKKVNPKYTLTHHMWEYLQAYAKKHQSAGHGFGFGLVTPESVSKTLLARYYKDGSEILVAQGENECPRRLTPRECARLMGFPDTFRIPVSDTQAYTQFGNSVIVPLVNEIAKIMLPKIIV